MEGLGIDLKLLIAQIINFGLFFYVFKRFLAKPFVHYIDEEKQKELEREKSFQKAKKLEEEALKKEQEALTKVRKEAQEIIKEAKQIAEKLKEEVLAQAQEEVREIKKKAQKQVELEKEAVYADAKEKITKLSFFIVQNALREVLSDDLKKKITERILKNSSKQLKLS